MLEAEALWFVAAALAAFLTAGALAPLETLSWWAGEAHRSAGQSNTATPAPAGARFVIYLGGIDTVDGQSHSERELRFLAHLGKALAPDVVLTGVFAYAASGEPLLEAPRAFRWLWRRLTPEPGAQRRALASLINLRNMFQVLVSADRRYGPIFNVAIADLIANALIRAGWSGHPYTIIGYSGGAQMAVAAAPFLYERLHVAAHAISMGGAILSTRGITALSHLDHIVSVSDPAPKVAAVAAASRWPITPFSPWRQALKSERLSITQLGPMQHNGRAGYLGDLDTAAAATPNWSVTLSAVLASLARARGHSAAHLPQHGFEIPSKS